MARLRIAVLLTALLASIVTVTGPPAPASASEREQQADELADEAAEEPDGTLRVLVTLDADTRAEIRDAREEVLEEVAGEVDAVRSFDRLPVLAMDATADGIETLGDADEVLTVIEDRVLHPMLDQTVPLVQADDTTTLGIDGTGFNVAVLDTGVQSDHPFLSGKVVDEACFSSGEDCPNGTATQTGAGAGAPCTFHPGDCEHGTHVAGIAAGVQAAAASGPTQGVAPGAGIVSVQVFSADSGSRAYTVTSDLLAGLNWVYTNRESLDLAAVNLSLGSADTFDSTCDSLDESEVLKPLIDDLRAAGIATVIASGNEGEVDRMSWPACISTAVSVAASDNDDDVALYSNVASFLSLLAPGDDVESSIPGSSFDVFDGTSMAAPHVAGAWAAIREALASEAEPPSVSDVLAGLRATGTLVDDVVVQDIPRLDLLAAMRPAAPTGLGTTSSATDVTISWTPPAWIGATDVSGYEITASPAPEAGLTTRTAAAGATSFAFSDLADDVSYTFTVRAINAQGSGVAATTSPTGLADVPDAPTGVNASAGDGRATVRWTAPDANNSPITSYEVTVDPTTGVTGSTTRSVAPSATQLSFTGLTNGTAYTFTVVAANAIGDSPPSAPSAPVTPRRSSSGGGGGGGGGSSSSSTTTTTTTTTPPASAEVTRLADADRIATAVTISRDRFADGSAGAVVLTTGDQFADALGGTPFAVAATAPILLTPSTGPLADGTRGEIRRVLPAGQTVYVLGGERAVPGVADETLRQDGYSVVRLAGNNRFETAAAIATAKAGGAQAILLADGQLFPDALAGGAAATKLGGVVLLTDGAAMPPATASYLDAHPQVPVYALGGRAAAAAPGATAIAGADRYETARLTAERFFAAPAFVGVASGISFADALGGGAHAGSRGGPLLLTPQSSLGDGPRGYLTSVRASLDQVALYGGVAALDDTVFQSVSAAVTG